MGLNRKRSDFSDLPNGLPGWENLQIEKHKSVRWSERTPSWFVLFDLQIFSGGVYPPSATSRTISFSVSNWIVFGINDSFFFRCLRRSKTSDKDGNRDVSPSQGLLQSTRRSKTPRKNANCFEECNVLATESVNSAPFKRGERGANFWQGKVQNS